MSFGVNTEKVIAEVHYTIGRYGSRNIIVLSGVAGTGKTHVSLVAAQRYCGHPLFVKQIQFHQSFSYEDFIEGLRPTPEGGFEIREGVFLDWNETALRDPNNKYVLLIEEFTRANINAVLGELMTYLEHRNRTFDTALSRRPVKIADNLVLLATMNPRDRSALEVDDALIRRLRIIDCPPDVGQLQEMLNKSLAGRGETPGDRSIIEQLTKLFTECESKHQKTYREEMPFGHGIFAGVKNETDLQWLWHQRIKHLLKRPLIKEHAFTKVIEDNYPWREVPEAPASAHAVGLPQPSARPVTGVADAGSGVEEHDDDPEGDDDGDAG